MDFSVEQQGPFRYLTHPQVRGGDFRYGFTAGGRGRYVNAEEEYRALCAAFGVHDVLTLKQVHGVGSVDLRGADADYLRTIAAARPEGDAIILSRRELLGYACIIRTADCVPLIVVGENSLALIHAGWRGLAAGIIPHVLAQLKEQHLRVLIGPCAGPERYEVGSEVIAAFDNRAICKPSVSGRSFLALAATAIEQIKQSHRNSVIFDCAICTIADRDFHSFRRDGEKSGRNLTFWLNTP